jgi:hypothetical protein
MQFNLKRATDLSRAALAAADEINVDGAIPLAVHVNDVHGALAEGRASFERSVSELEALISAHFTLRSLIGTANAKAGVSELLARAARLEMLEKRLTGILSALGKRNEAGASADVLAARVAAARHRYDEGNNYAAEVIHLSVVDTPMRRAVVQRRTALRAERAALLERVAALNIMEKIEIDTGTEAALRSAGIIH